MKNHEKFQRSILFPADLNAMTQPSLEQRLADFERDGYTLFPGLFSASEVASWREKYEQLQADGIRSGQGEKPMPTWWFGDVLELAPRIVLPVVSNPQLLDFIEAIWGPFVQIDNVTLAGFPSTDAASKGKISGWHRDRYSGVPYAGIYIRPTAVNVITYGQDLTEETGPFRVIPGSHKNPTLLAPEQINQPHPDERVFHLKAGDAALIHHSTIHSGTANVSGKTRLFFSIFYNHTCMRHVDSHAGPTTQRILREARARNDHRMMRLLGMDEQLEARVNSGFMKSDKAQWAAWSAADKAALKA